jgi:hypothetical protein
MGEDKLNIKTKDKTKAMDSLFEQFWTAYPKKVSKSLTIAAFSAAPSTNPKTCLSPSESAPPNSRNQQMLTKMYTTDNEL